MKGDPRLSTEEIVTRLDARFGGTVPLAVSRDGRGAHVVTGREHLLPVLDALKSDPELAFDVLIDLTAVDYLHLDRLEMQAPELQGARFVTVYQLESFARRHRLRIAARIPGDDLIVPSAATLWPSAVWAEREIGDLFGIEFDDHPDPRRLLLPENYPGFPLRKDEPAAGSGRRAAYLESRGFRGPRLDVARASPEAARPS